MIKLSVSKNIWTTLVFIGSSQLLLHLARKISSTQRKTILVSAFLTNPTQSRHILCNHPQTFKETTTEVPIGPQTIKEIPTPIMDLFSLRQTLFHMHLQAKTNFSIKTKIMGWKRMAVQGDRRREIITRENHINYQEDHRLGPRSLLRIKVNSEAVVNPS
jgi:hypothetical protein